MADVISNPAGYLLSGLSASASSGNIMDTRAALGRGLLVYIGIGASANVTFQMSWDTTGWVDVALYTAQTGVIGTAQVSDYYPYVRGIINASYSGAAGTGQPMLHFSPLV